MFIDHRSSNLSVAPLCPLKLLELIWLRANSCMQKKNKSNTRGQKGIRNCIFFVLNVLFSREQYNIFGRIKLKDKPVSETKIRFE